MTPQLDELVHAGLVLVTTLSIALVLRACRPGGIPPARATWFDHVAARRHEDRRAARR